MEAEYPGCWKNNQRSSWQRKLNRVKEDAIKSIHPGSGLLLFADKKRGASEIFLHERMLTKKYNICVTIPKPDTI